MKVYVTASSNEKYPGLLGLHDFESLDDAMRYVRAEAPKLYPSFNDDTFVIIFNEWSINYYHADVVIEIYDDYRE